MRQRELWISAALATLISLALAQAAWAGAISDEEELAHVGSGGNGAGQLETPLAVASDSTTGHLYVTEEPKAVVNPDYRVSEFTPWGGFVKAFGWDVAPGVVNEQQEVRVRAAAGQFKLSFESEATGDLPFNASGAEVEAALNSLPAIGAGGVSVAANPGTLNGKTPFIYVVAFKGPSLAGDNVPPLGAVSGTTALSGGDPETELEARTRADGTSGGVGLESCTKESGCKGGLEGGGAGQLSRAPGATVDAAGNVYVKEIENHRVQKFDSAGRFVWMAGGDVNKTKAEAAAPEAQRNLCPVDPGDVCQAGTTGTGNGQFSPSLGGEITVCGGSLFAADKERVQRFSLAGAFEASLPVPGEAVQSLACDPLSSDLYATYEPKADVHKLDSATGAEVGKVQVASPGDLATDADGDLFVNFQESEVLEFDSAGKPLSPPSCCEAAAGQKIKALGTNLAGDLHVAYRSASAADNYVGVFGPGPVGFESPPPVPPEIKAQFASSVQRDGATVAAEVNPHFFTDAHYFVQYGTGECSKGGCPAEAPLPPGPLLTAKATSSAVRTAGVVLEGLQPGTTYHYRFIAKSSGGGPAYGVDPDGEGPKAPTPEAGLEAAFTTFPTAFPARLCANDAFRSGAAARLPDCRAYEMVSPVDKNNGDIKTVPDAPGYNTSLSKGAADGGRFTYSSYRGFGDPAGAPYANQYLAERDPLSGWSSAPLSAAQKSRYEGNASFENRYKAFTEDLCSGWLVANAEPVLAPGAPAGYQEPYRREGCGPVGYEALAQAQPTVIPGPFYPVLGGFSADGSGAAFVVKDKLTEEAASGMWQAYYASKGQPLRLICVGPNGLASGGNCAVGTGSPSVNQPDLERLGSLTHAVSADGSRAYWTDSGASPTGVGKVYLRLNPGEAQSAMSGATCTEAAKACTVKVSELKSTKASRFLGASADGSKALFEVAEGPQAGTLYEFTLGGSTREVAGEAIGVAGASESLSHVYFISREAIAGTTGATAGKPNLYLDEGGEAAFIATLSEADVTGKIPSNATPEALYHAARASKDGRALAFISTERLTGYDNTDLASGKADSEAYLYEAGAGRPVCVSCNPSGARPQGRVVQGAGPSPASLPTAAGLTMPEGQLYSPRVLSEDGRRLFFNSFDALLPRDTNGKGDVYEWESAGSQAACEEKGAELYVASARGCLSLISTGESPQDSALLDASASGGDAFFATNTSLLPRDPGLIDVYDARVGGGIAEPPPPPPSCQGEACQPSASAPGYPAPASSSYEGPEDEKPKKKKKKKKHHKKHKKKAAKKKGGRR